MQVANAFGCLDRRAGENARAPWLLAQLFRKLRRELFQLINVGWLADEGEGQRPNLREITIVNFQAFNRFEPAGKEIQDLAIQVHPRNENVNRCRGNQRDRAPDGAAPSIDQISDERMKAHDKPGAQPRCSRFNQRTSKAENESFVAGGMAHGCDIARRHENLAQLQPPAQSRRRLRARAGPTASRERTSHARVVCVLANFEKGDAGPLRKSQLEIARFRETHKHFADQRGLFPAIKQLAVPGLPIPRWVEKMVPDCLTTRQANATGANDRQKFEE